MSIYNHIYKYIFFIFILRNIIFESITTAKIIPDNSKSDFYCHTA